MAGMAALIGERAMTRRAGLDSRLRGNDESGWVYSWLDKPRPFLAEALDNLHEKIILHYRVQYSANSHTLHRGPYQFG